MANSQVGATPVEIDFEAVYRGETDGGVDVEPNIPWDIGEPQPALVEIEESGGVWGEVLDLGCGLGDNAIFLAQRGHQVTAVDISPTAVDIAGRRAARSGADIAFAVADVTEMDGIATFDTVIDSAVMHCLDSQQRPGYVAALRRVTVPGSTVHVLCCSDTEEFRMPVPYPLPESMLRELFAQGWRIEELTTSLYTAAMDRAAYEGVLRAQNAPVDAVEEVEFDPVGRLRFPVWKLLATRT